MSNEITFTMRMDPATHNLLTMLANGDDRSRGSTIRRLIRAAAGNVATPTPPKRKRSVTPMLGEPGFTDTLTKK